MNILSGLSMAPYFLGGTVLGICIYGLIDYLDEKSKQKQVSAADSTNNVQNTHYPDMNSALAKLGAATAGKTMMGQDQAEYAKKAKADKDNLYGSAFSLPAVPEKPSERITVSVTRDKNGRFKSGKRRKK